MFPTAHTLRYLPGRLAWLLLLVATSPATEAIAQNQTTARHQAYWLPVGDADKGIPAGLGYLMRRGFNATDAYNTGDQNLYWFLHWEEFIPHNTVRRSGPVSMLRPAPHKPIGRVKAETTLGELTLDDWIAHLASRVQAYVVVRDGQILYETYPGMREDDHHLWFSVSKTLAGLMVGLLEADGLIDVDLPIDAYLPELTSTHWQGIRIIDILDMASGLDLAESEQSRTDRHSTVGRFFRIELGDTSDMGQHTSDQILFAAGAKGPPGELFEYSSLDTKMLGLLVERVSGQRFADLLSDRVWSKMGAEGDGLLGVNREGGPAVYGMMSSRLRDLARYGMLYTSSWNRIAAKRVVPQVLLDDIRACRPELFANAMKARGSYDEKAEMRCNSRQWDVVWQDGDMYKGGARGQGLYVSPERNLVIAWYSTTSEGGWMNYAREIARSMR